MSRPFRMIFAVALLVTTTGQALAKKKPPPGPVAPTACTDFYEVSNRDWLLAHPLPANGGSASRWLELNATADRQTRELLARGEANGKGPATQVLADVVASSRDLALMTQAANNSAKPFLAKITAIKQAKDIATILVALQAAGIPAIYDFDVLRDVNTGQPHGTFRPAALGLPGREYYGRNEPALKALAAQYRQSLVAMLTAAGLPSAKVGPQADAALALESTLAGAMATPGEKVMAVPAVAKSWPTLLLPDALKALAIAPDEVIVLQPDYFKAVDKMLAKPVITQWQAYLRVRVMAALADALPEDPRRAYLSVLGRAPAATVAERLSNWIRDEGADLLDVAYAESYVGSDRQQEAQAIGEAVRAAMARAINNAAWMSADGKAAAISKLGAMRLAIGKPFVPVTLEGLTTDRDDLAGNVLAIRRWNRARALARLATPNWPWPVDQTRPVIGYQAADNRLIVTAAALQPPVFGNGSQAADFGALGALVGQQMSLGFADFTGNDGIGFGKRQLGLLGQFAAYPASAVTRVDGMRTQRMNTADLSGLELAWDAYRSHAAADNSGDPVFFAAWAALWARQDTDAAQAAAAATSLFAPSRWRVNGPLANLPAFAKTFACKKDQPMAHDGADRTSIWR